MGTPDLAAGALAALHQAGYDLPLVVTQPDKTGGRGQKQMDSPVKTFATCKGLNVYQPTSVKEYEAIQRIRDAGPDVIVVAAYGKILPAELLELAPLGCLNIHASLLPAYRGAAPIQWALLNGEKETGVTIMKLDEGVDTGPVLLQEKLTISDDMDFGGLYKTLTDMGARLLLEALPLWAEGSLKPRSQPMESASYATRLERRDEIADWSKPADMILNQIRAFSPAPGTQARFGEKDVKILSARKATEEDAKAQTSLNKLLPGQIVSVLKRQGPVVATGEGCLVITQMQPSGKKPMDGWSWVNGSRAQQGQMFS
jgi:methionyl-tRNA formyltransferase